MVVLHAPAPLDSVWQSRHWYVPVYDGVFDVGNANAVHGNSQTASQVGRIGSAYPHRAGYTNSWHSIGPFHRVCTRRARMPMARPRSAFAVRTTARHPPKCSRSFSPS